MDYNELLNMATDFGCRLQECGAEIYRIEESVRRIMAAYGIDNAEVFAIPNCLIVSFTTPDGESKTKLRRIPSHGTDVNLLEKYNALGRRLCKEQMPLSEAQQAICDVSLQVKEYPLWLQLIGYFVCTYGFCLFFGGSWPDSIAAGICGVFTGLCLKYMSRLDTNLFSMTLMASFVSALLALAFANVGIGNNSGYIIIGAMMALVPGVLITNFMRDIIGGEMVAGLIKLTESLVIGSAIGIGTGVAMSLFRMLTGA